MVEALCGCFQLFVCSGLQVVVLSGFLRFETSVLRDFAHPVYMLVSQVATSSWSRYLFRKI